MKYNKILLAIIIVFVLLCACGENLENSKSSEISSSRSQTPDGEISSNQSGSSTDKTKTDKDSISAVPSDGEVDYADLDDSNTEKPKVDDNNSKETSSEENSSNENQQDNHNDDSVEFDDDSGWSSGWN